MTTIVETAQYAKYGLLAVLSLHLRNRALASAVFIVHVSTVSNRRLPRTNDRRTQYATIPPVANKTTAASTQPGSRTECLMQQKNHRLPSKGTKTTKSRPFSVAPEVWGVIMEEGSDWPEIYGHYRGLKNLQMAEGLVRTLAAARHLSDTDA
ncbi:hypothetical protein BGAL_0055g00450 [Botrytis galanthina]|uniref:Uncharacterized protein n=1 Tax=Botrytis galanthina TaxID=278940 RepID=A0A4V4HVH4_9HELO|nr:hypothetical protein BGAL_0055g00450 [Botrytis galanthina]